MRKYKISRIFRDETNLVFKIKFPESKSFTDIEDVKFLIKATESTPLVSAIIEKTYLEIPSQIELIAPNYASVKWDVTDYDNMNIGDVYKAALFCKWNGNSDFDENVESLYDFEIIQNFDNNN